MKKILCIFLSILFLASGLVSNVSAGDENNPEVVDEEQDLLTSREVPLPKFLYPIFKSIDIISGWFSENHETPDMLSVSLKVNTFEYKPFNTKLIFWWSYNDIDYVAGFITHSNGLFKVGCAGYIDENGTEFINAVNYSIDTEENIITFYVPKNYIGYPTSGSELYSPWIWTGCVFQNALLSRLWKRELAKDFTYAIDGKTYIVQY